MKEEISAYKREHSERKSLPQKMLDQKIDCKVGDVLFWKWGKYPVSPFIYITGYDQETKEFSFQFIHHIFN